VVAARSAFRVVPQRPAGYLTVDWALDVTPHLGETRFAVRVAVTGIDAVAVGAEAGDDASADAFTAVGSAQRKAGTPLRDAPLVVPAVGVLTGTRLDLLEDGAGAVVHGVADDGSPASTVTAALAVVTWRPRRPGADDAITRTGDVTLLLVGRFVGNVADGVVNDELLHHVDTPDVARLDGVAAVLARRTRRPVGSAPLEEIAGADVARLRFLHRPATSSVIGRFHFHLSLSGADARAAGGITRRPSAPLGHGAVGGAWNVATSRLVILLVAPWNGSQLGDGRDQALPAPELLAAAARAEVILQQAGRPILTLQSDPLARAVLLAVLGHAAVLFVAPPDEVVAVATGADAVAGAEAGVQRSGVLARDVIAGHVTALVQFQAPIFVVEFRQAYRRI